MNPRRLQGIAAVAMAMVMLLTCLAPASRVAARNVDLSTVPDRQTVQLTIYNSEDLTLVRETRAISFSEGANPLQFSWANTLIDSSSVQLRFLTHEGDLEVLDTTYPHDKPQMLYWNVNSEFDGEAKVEISYFTSGISWSADYVAIANTDETEMRIESFVRVHNNSGEDYEDAEVRLVVGTINLVEKIAQLARRSMAQVTGDPRLQAQMRPAAARQMMVRGTSMEMAADSAASGPAPKQVIKEGLSEYFIYTIEGRETVPTGWSKRLRSFDAESAPFKVEYRYRPQQYGHQLVRLYLLTNDETSNLGETPLPDGVVRVFRKRDGGGLSFVGNVSIPYVPIGDKMELNLGVDPEVIFELRKERTFRDELWLQLHGANVFRKVGGNIDIEPRSSVAGWDEHTIFAERLRNFTGRPISVEIRRTFGGHVEVRPLDGLAAKNHDYNTVEFKAEIATGETKDLRYEHIQKQGHNAKQNNVTIID